MRDLHARITDFEWRTRMLLATRRVDTSFGVFAVTDDMPLVYDQNMGLVNDGSDPATVLAGVEEVAVAAGWAHRSLEIVDDTVADQLRAALKGAGYTEHRQVTMTLGTPAGAIEAGVSRAVVVPVSQQLHLGRALLAAEPWVRGEEVLEQFARRELRLGEAVSASAVVAPPQDPVSRCLLLSDGDMVEVDAVSTLGEHQGQGWSTAVMCRAIAEARVRGAQHVVLVAEADDWPRQWYERLGFEVVGVLSQFRRWPG